MNNMFKVTCGILMVSSMTVTWVTVRTSKRVYFQKLCEQSNVPDMHDIFWKHVPVIAQLDCYPGLSSSLESCRHVSHLRLPSTLMRLPQTGCPINVTDPEHFQPAFMNNSKRNIILRLPLLLRDWRKFNTEHFYFIKPLFTEVFYSVKVYS